VGLEDTEDIIEDLDKALKEAVSGVVLQTVFKLLSVIAVMFIVKTI